MKLSSASKISWFLENRKLEAKHQPEFMQNDVNSNLELVRKQSRNEKRESRNKKWGNNKQTKLRSTNRPTGQRFSESQCVFINIVLFISRPIFFVFIHAISKHTVNELQQRILGKWLKFKRRCEHLLGVRNTNFYTAIRQNYMVTKLILEKGATLVTKTACSKHRFADWTFVNPLFSFYCSP